MCNRVTVKDLIKPYKHDATLLSRIFSLTAVVGQFLAPVCIFRLGCVDGIASANGSPYAIGPLSVCPVL